MLLRSFNPAAVESFPRLHARTRRFTLGAPRNFTVLPQTGTSTGPKVAFLRSMSGIDPELALWTLDYETGTETKIVDPTDLGTGGALSPAERARRERARESAGGVVSYAMAADAPVVAFSLGGALFTANVEDGVVTGHSAAEPAFDPRPNSTGTKVAYVCGAELRLLDIATGQDQRLSPGETEENVKWGVAEFVAAEEMGRSRGFWWSPDGNQILATRVDDAPITEWFIADPANPQTVPTQVRYPAAGTNNASVTLAILSTEHHDPMTVPWNRSSEDNKTLAFEYLADAGWTPDGSIMVVRQTRDQRTVSIGEVSAVKQDGSEAVLQERHRITDETWVELHAGVPAFDDGQLLTIEDIPAGDAPGRRALCVDGAPVTDSRMHVKSLAGVVQGQAVITAWTDSAEVHIFAIPLEPPAGDQSSPAVQLTDEPGIHTVTVGGDHLVITSSTPDSFSSQTWVARMDPGPVPLVKPGPTIATLVEDPGLRADAHFCRLGSRGLATAVFLPSGHDGSTKLPVLLDPYGGPHAQRVLKNHNSHLVSRWFAEQGFVVVVADGRGTPGRGPEFEREVWGDLAGPVLEDQLDALDAAAQEFGVLDLSRVGIRGWSFGGYLAALAVLRAPERVHAAIAGAPVTTWELYDTHYTERYLGHPADYPDHYSRTNLISEADALTRPLLLIHGLADDNVVAAHTLRLSSALLAHGRAHRVLPLSGVTHMTPQEVVAENLLHLQRDFLQETIVGATRRL